MFVESYLTCCWVFDLPDYPEALTALTRVEFPEGSIQPHEGWVGRSIIYARADQQTMV